MNLESVTMPDRVKHKEEAAFLVAHPGEWFKVTTRETIDAAASFGHQISIGRKRAFRPPGHFEGRTHGLDVMGRYVGPDE